MSDRSPATSHLLERGDEIERLTDALDQARAGVGHLLLVEGEPGIGKTALLAELAELGHRRGFTVLGARGGQLERDYAHGIVRQLYEGHMRELSDELRQCALRGAAALAAPIVGVKAGPRPQTSGPRVADAAFAANHGLYWLTVELADQRPLLLVIDDGHWSDSASMLFLNYLGRRLDDIPLVVALGLRPVEPGAPQELIEALRMLPGTERLAPGPLSLSGTAGLISRRLGRPPEHGFLTTCHEATGGNPFLLGELLSALAAQEVEPGERAVELVARLGPRSISRSVLGRLAMMWPEAVSLAQAVAVLGSDCQLQHAAALAGLEPGEAALAVDELIDAHVFAPGRPLTFTHPIVRQAVYADLAEGRRRNHHARAAHLLDAGGDGDRAAVHLLASEPVGDAWVVERLRAAADRALARGAPREAAALLRRALDEPPDPDEAVAVVTQLGQAELLAGDLAALDHLGRALTMTPDPRLRAQIAVTLAGAAAPGEAVVQVVRLLEDVLNDLPPAERSLAHLLEGNIIALSILHKDLIHSAWSRLDRVDAAELGDSPGDRVLLAWLAARSVLRGDSALEARSLATRALDGGRLLREQLAHSQHSVMASAVLGYVDRLDEAYASYTAGLEDSRRRGSEAGFAIASCFRSWPLLRMGELAPAEADARRAVELAEGTPLLAAILRYTLYSLVELLVRRGELEVAERELQRLPAGWEDFELSDVSLVLHSRGLLRLAQGEAGAALDDFLGAGDRLLDLGMLNPAWLPWRSNAALAHHALGQPEQALSLAREEHERAERFGARSAMGVALRALGLVTGGHQGLALLREAVGVLAPTQARLEHAEALVALGSALRRANRRSEARDHLRQGMDLARHRGAMALAQLAHEELRATGARPRRLVETGVGSLTASERRVARMAAEGRSNPQIAQALFVTRKTVETHLGHVYRKLGVAAREQLAQALDEPW